MRKNSDDSYVTADLRIAVKSPHFSEESVDFQIPLAAVTTFLCPTCPKFHLQIDTGPPVTDSLRVRIGLRLSPEDAEKLAAMLSYPDALRAEDAEEGLP